MKETPIKARPQKTILILSILITLAISIIGLGIDKMNASTLRDVLENANCAKACWQDIEPGVSNESFMINQLETSNIDFSMFVAWEGGGAKVYTVVLKSDTFYVAKGSQVDFDILDGVVDQIRLNTGICVTQIINEYGEPFGVIEGDTFFDLLYPEYNLIFGVFKTAPTQARTIIIVTNSRYDKYIERTISKIPSYKYISRWDEIDHIFLGECN